MPDVEKVIKGLECCQDGCVSDCPYWTSPFGSASICRSDMEKDALTLLKAQEAFKIEIKHAISNIDIPKGVDEEQFLAVLSQQYAALAKLYGEDVPTYSPS